MRPLSSVSKPGERARESGLPGFMILIQNEGEGAIAEYTVDEFEDKFAGTLWGLGKASAENAGPLGAEEILSELDTKLHVLALRDPSGALLSAFGTPGATFWSSIAQDAPIDIIDKPLELIQHCLEIAAVLAGVGTGHVAWVYAGLKELFHSVVHDLSVAVVKDAMSGDNSHNPEPSQPEDAPPPVIAPDPPLSIRERDRKFLEELERDENEGKLIGGLRSTDYQSSAIENPHTEPEEPRPGVGGP